MVDRIKLKEAIRTFESWEKLARERNPEAYDKLAIMSGSPRPVWELLVNAAVLVADEDTLVIDWCETHDSAAHDLYPRTCDFSRIEGGADCRMVERVLLAAEVGSGTQ
jgi:hypothetical protein